jgi:hypothetical protein
MATRPFTTNSPPGEPSGPLRTGEEAHRRVRERYLAPHRLIQEMDLIERLTG